MNHRTIRTIVAPGAGIVLLGAAWWALAGPLNPAAPPASTGKSLQEVYDLTNSIKGAALPAPLVLGTTTLFLNVDGISGESTDPDHRYWIEPSAYHWGVTRAGLTFPLGTSAAAPADFGALTVVKRIDKATPKLFIKCCNGSLIPAVTLEIWPTATFFNRPLIKYELSDVIVTGSKPVGANTNPDYLMEEVGFDYRSIKITYNEFDPKTGAFKGATVATWNRETNQGA